MAGLIKGTDKLPKFTLEVGFHRHPKWVGASAQAIGVFVASLSYCAEHGTDGRLMRAEGRDDSLATALGIALRDVRRVRKELVERGLWEIENGWLQVHDYLDHNPSAAEVKDNARRRAAASEKANHVKHHVLPHGTPNPEICGICETEYGPPSEPPSEPDSESDSESETPTDSATEAKRTPRGEERREGKRTSRPPLPPR